MERDAPVISLVPKRAAAELQSRSDDELMSLATSGLLEAYCELMRRHQGPLRGFCARLLASRAQGDDVAQEVFLHIWKMRARYQKQGRFRGFLFTAARNRCLNELRARRGVMAVDQRDIGEPSDLPVKLHAHLDTLLAVERRQQLDRMVARLPPKLRDAIWLRYAADLDYHEIAQIVNRPEETVRSRIFHGLSRLRKSLGASQEGR